MTRPIRFNLVAGDWPDLERKLSQLTKWMVSQPVISISSPTFAGLTLTGFSGVLKATAGVLAGSAAHSDLGSVTANQHHNQAHVLNASDHTVSGLTTGHVLQATSATTFGFSTVPAGGVPAAHASSHAVAPGGSDPVDHNTLTNYAANKHFLQTDITNISTALGTGFVKNTTGSGALSIDTNTYYKSGDSPSFVTGTLSSQLKILESGSTPTKYSIFQGGDQSVDLTYTLPTAYPASIAFLKISDTGVMTTDVATYSVSSHNHSGTYEPHTDQLTALAGIATTVGLVKQTSAGVFGIDTSTYLTSFTESDPVAMGYIDQAVKTTSGPTFDILKVDAVNHRIGIGIASPTKRFELWDTAADALMTGGVVEIDPAGLTHYFGRISGTGGSTDNWKFRNRFGSTLLEIASDYVDFYTPLHILYFNYAASKVGILTAAPNEALEVAGKIRALTCFNLNGTDGVSDSGAGVPTALTISGGIITAVTKNDYLDQAVKTTSSPTFAGLTVDTNTIKVDSVNHFLGVGVSPVCKFQVAGGIILNKGTSNTSDMSSWANVNANYQFGSGYWGIREGISTHAFNIDVDNSSSPKPALTILQNGNAGFSTTLGVTGLTTLTGGAEIKEDTYFTGAGSGFPYGEIYGIDVASALVMDAQDTWYQFIGFAANGASNLATCDHTTDDITIVKTGVYRISFHVSVLSATATDFVVTLAKNNGATILTCADSHVTTIAGAKDVSASSGCIVSLTAGDTVELWAKRTNGAAVSKTLTFAHATMGLFQVGG